MRLRKKSINTDDTGARHDGKNGYCTHIGTPLFTYFKSTESKSCINFPGVLRGNYTDYVVSDECLDYILVTAESEIFDPVGFASKF